MIWLALGAALLAFFVWLGRRGPTVPRAEWRTALALLALGLLVAGAVFALRGLWAPALVLIGASVTTATLARRPPRLKGPEMSAEEARALLGVGPDADEEQVQAAYVRLMRRVHPDVGGATGLAAQLNAARDRLLREIRR